MTDLPKVAGRAPVRISLKEGQNYAYCTCGLSDNQPFCNGSHKGTGYSPVVFKAESDQDMTMCMCKQTGNAPRCDGQHKCLVEE